MSAPDWLPRLRCNILHRTSDAYAESGALGWMRRSSVVYTLPLSRRFARSLEGNVAAILVHFTDLDATLPDLSPCWLTESIRAYDDHTWFIDWADLAALGPATWCPEADPARDACVSIDSRTYQREMLRALVALAGPPSSGLLRARYVTTSRRTECLYLEPRMVDFPPWVYLVMPIRASLLGRPSIRVLDVHGANAHQGRVRRYEERNERVARRAHA